VGDYVAGMSASCTARPVVYNGWQWMAA